MEKQQYPITLTHKVSCLVSGCNAGCLAGATQLTLVELDGVTFEIKNTWQNTTNYLKYLHTIVIGY